MLVNRVRWRSYPAWAFCLFAASLLSPAEAADKTQKFAGAGSSTFSFASADGAIRLSCETTSLPKNDATLFIAFRAHHEIGSALHPFGTNAEGSTVFLPFNGDTLVAAHLSQQPSATLRLWRNWKWEDAQPCEAKIEVDSQTISVTIPKAFTEDSIDCAVYLKDMSANNGWGKLIACNDRGIALGENDKYIPTYFRIDAKGQPLQVTVRSRLGSEKRIRIYQLFVRLFGNTNEHRKQNGTLSDNGTGKFGDINEVALNSLRDCGFTHIWLTGVLQQATGTDYSNIGQPADDPDLLKGIAGSPYAIKDYFDVCPDYADKPTERLSEFKQLLERIHRLDLKAMIDLVPNHVARSYDSDIKPELNFGSHGNGGNGDDTSRFFWPQNNFFYLTPDANGRLLARARGDGNRSGRVRRKIRQS